MTYESDVPCLAATYFANNSYHLSLAFCLQFLFTDGRSVTFLCHSALGSCVLSLCTILFLFINYQVHMLIGYESGSFVRAVPPLNVQKQQQQQMSTGVEFLWEP